MKIKQIEKVEWIGEEWNRKRSKGKEVYHHKTMENCNKPENEEKRKGIWAESAEQCVVLAVHDIEQVLWSCAMLLGRNAMVFRTCYLVIMKKRCKSEISCEAQA